MTLERSAENLLCQLKITLGTIQQFARDNPIIDIPIFRTAVSILRKGANKSLNIKTCLCNYLNQIN